MIQGILSLAAIFCLVAGWMNLFSPEINDFLYRKVFFVLIGASFLFMAPVISNKNFIYPMYIAGVLCIAGSFIPEENRFAAIKTIGLFAGVIISLFNRPKVQRDQS